MDSMIIPLHTYKNDDDENVCDFYGNVAIFIRLYPDFTHNLSKMDYIVSWDIKPTKCIGFERSHVEEDVGQKEFNDLDLAKEFFSLKLKSIYRD